MPVEIRELVVQTNTTEAMEQSDIVRPGNESQGRRMGIDPEERRMIIEESVQKTLDIIEMKMNR